MKEELEHIAIAKDDPMNSTIYVVVPVFNRVSYTEIFLSCLHKQTFKNYKVIVVDDGSTDGTSELIRKRFKEVQLLTGVGNLWWTGAINVGIRHAMAQASDDDAVLIINDDLEVNPDYLEVLHGLSRAMPRTLIGSVVVDIDNPDIIEHGGVITNWLTAKRRKLNCKKRLSEFQTNHSVNVSYLTGRGTLIPVRAFREIGLYDDKHFQQCGDIEFPVRAKNNGYRLVVSYAAIVKSHINASDASNISTYYSFKDSKSYFFGVKSNFRLKYHFYFSLKTARNPFYFMSFFLCDLLRSTYHFVIRLRLKR